MLSSVMFARFSFAAMMTAVIFLSLLANGPLNFAYGASLSTWKYPANNTGKPPLNSYWIPGKPGDTSLTLMSMNQPPELEAIKAVFYSSNLTCGVRASVAGDRTNNINHGSDNRNGGFPWQVLVVAEYPGIMTIPCGGALLSDTWVLTAAHCLMYRTRVHRPSEPMHVTVFLNIHDLSSEGPNIVNASDWKIHPNFSDPEVGVVNDVGVVRIPSIGEKAGNLMPICLPDRDMDDEYLSVITAGWGQKESSGVEAVLRFTNARTLDSKLCRDALGIKSRNLNEEILESIPESIICVDHHTNATVCHGDSGGPLIHEQDGVFYVIGVVSKIESIRCGQPIPHLFTNVKTNLDFICQETGLCS